MSPRQRTLRILGGCLLGIAALVMCYYAYGMLASGMNTLAPALLCVALVCAPLLTGALALALSTPAPEQRQKIVSTVLWVLFGFYLLALFGALVFARIDFANYAATQAEYRANWELMTNFIPGETIRLYIRCLIYDYIGSTIPLSNLMGNVLLFMPMGLFLPCLFPSLRKFLRFLLLSVALLLAVEALQLVLCCGSCDVDDVILNLVGLLLVYAVVRIPPVWRLLEKCLCVVKPAQTDGPENQPIPS